MKILTDTLWALDGHHHKFVDANRVDKIPDCFSYQEPFRALKSNGMTKKKPKPLNKDDLDIMSMNLLKLLETKEMKKSRFERLAWDIKKLSKSLIQYSDYLDNKNRSSNENHACSVPVATLRRGNDSSLKKIEKYTQKDTGDLRKKLEGKYKELADELSTKGYYEEIDVSDFAPDERKERWRYYKNIRVPFRTYYFEKIVGGSNNKIVYIWKIPDDEEDEISGKSYEICKKIESMVPTYHTRHMIKRATTNWKWLKDIKPNYITALYK